MKNLYKVLLQTILALIPVFISGTALSQITLTNFNGGESYLSGTTETITWTNEGTGNSIEINYSVDGGAHWTIAGTTGNTGSWQWTIPVITSADCRLRLMEYKDGEQTGLFDDSDSSFEIEPYNFRIENVSFPSQVPLNSEFTVELDHIFEGAITGSLVVTYQIHVSQYNQWFGRYDHIIFENTTTFTNENRSEHLEIPINLENEFSTTGAYYLMAGTDPRTQPDDDINESNEDDNVVINPITLTEPLINPVTTNARLVSMHRGDDLGNEGWGLEAYVNVADPQGLTDIASVTVTFPGGGTTYNLYDNGQFDGAPNDGYYGYHIWNITSAPPFGEYIFTVTDLEGHVTTTSDNLDVIVDFPRNVHPANNEIVTTQNPVFTWTALEGISSYSVVVHNGTSDIWHVDNVTVTSAEYTGPAFEEGRVYYYRIHVDLEGGRSWHDDVRFVYSSDANNPVAYNPRVVSMHRGDDSGNEGYGLEAYINVTDPQGPNDIASVTVTFPNGGSTYNLYDNGQFDGPPNDGYYGYHVWDITGAPPFGEYLFTITDKSGHIIHSTDNLELIVDYPRNVQPVVNSVVSTLHPVFTWTALEGISSYTVVVHNETADIWRIDNVTVTSAEYTGPAFIEGNAYYYRIQVDFEGGRSWHDDVRFFYRSFAGHRITVDQANVTGVENGSPEHPFSTIQEGINAAIEGDTILVKAGTYVENLVISNKVITLASEFVLTGNTVDISSTILDGNHAESVVNVQNSEFTLNGFTVQNGRAGEYGAGGIRIDGGNDVKVLNCIVQNNIGIGRDEWGSGGISTSANPSEIRNCIVRNNYSPRGSSAIRAGGCNLQVVNTLVADNTGALAFHFNDVTGDIINSAIVNNPGGSFGFNNSPLNLINSIEWNNAGNFWGQPGSVSWSCTQASLNGTGTIHQNPVFMDPFNGDFTLQLNSPCIDAGNPEIQFNDKNNSRNDMGYYGGPDGSSYSYLNGPPVINNLTVNPSQIYAGQALTITTDMFDAQSQVSSVTVQIEDPDETVLADINLYDDGNHNDNAAGDGIFANTAARDWEPDHHYFVDLAASDGSHNLVINNVSGFDGVNPPLTLNIAFTDEPMHIDGNAGESIWNTIPFVPVSNLIFGPLDGPDDLSASYKACWNLDSLFVLINVTDDVLDNIHGANYWENDKVSLYLDMDNSHGASYDENDWDMTYVWEGGFFPNRTFNGTRYAHHTNLQLNGYQLEIALSLKDLGYPMGDEIGLDLDIMDRDGSEPVNTLLFWNTKVNENYFNPGRNGFGNLNDYNTNMPDQALKITGLVDLPSCGTTNGIIRAQIYNFGKSPVNEFEIGYSINGLAISPETAQITINPGSTAEYTFATAADLPNTGNYSISVWTLLDNGDPHANLGLSTNFLVFGQNTYPNWTAYSTCNGLPENRFRYVMDDTKGNIWVGTNNGGAAKLDVTSGNWLTYNMANSGFSNNNVITLFEDHEGLIWAGLDGEDGIAETYNGSTWSAGNPNNRHVLTIFEDHNQNMWFGTWGSDGLRKWERNTGTWTVYNTTNSGLPVNDMWYGAIMEDTLHTMWFGTINGGLVRFDGNSWYTFNTSNSGIPTNLILASALDKKGNIWLGHGWENFGVTRFDGNNWTYFNTSNSGICSNTIADIFEDHNGYIWFGSYDNGASRYDGRMWTTFNMSNSGLTNNNINSITEDANGDMWFATPNGLCKLDVPNRSIEVVDLVDFPECGSSSVPISVRLKNTGMETISQFDILYSINNTQIQATETATVTIAPGDTITYTFNTRADLSNMGNYTVYVSTLLDGGTVISNVSLTAQRFVFGNQAYKEWKNYNTCNGLLPGNNITYIKEDSKKNLWVSISGEGLARFNSTGQTWTLFNTTNSGLTNNYPTAICEDHLGNIWVGCDGDDGIVTMYNGTSWSSDNPENIHVLSIMEDHAGNMWFGTWDHGVRKWDRTANTWTTYTVENSGMPTNITWFDGVMEDTQNNMWFACIDNNNQHGLAKFDGTTWTQYTSSNSTLPSNNLWGALMDSKGRMWLSLGWGQGAATFDGTNTIVYNESNTGTRLNSVVRINEDKEGNIWFSCSNGAIKFDGTAWTQYSMTNSGMAGNGANCIAGDHSGNVWIGGNGLSELLAEVKPVTLYTTEIPKRLSAGAYDFGTEFRALMDGNVTKARLYTNTNETGNHYVRLWQRDGSSYTMIAGPYTWNITSGTEGWREFTLPSPVELASGGVYIISISTGTDGNFVYTSNIVLASQNDGIEYIRSTYSAIGAVPSNSKANSYFRDIVFVPAGEPGLKTTDQPGIIKSPNDLTWDAILYPNPASHLAYIRFKRHTEGDALVEIRAINGSLLINSRITIMDDNIEIDVQELNRGIYFIRLTLNGQIKVFRMIKN